MIVGADVAAEAATVCCDWRLLTAAARDNERQRPLAVAAISALAGFACDRAPSFRAAEHCLVALVPLVPHNMFS
ncbi:hypothetical protein PF010_g15964 [Phytophthora fragariae]|uniref:Uncharacterized protein n=2 Tax=Phytophthora TaxID=4783 RepID=A0A6A4A014_9STRA|nr:hypothetical protein PF003_g29336 [Phytophthora fragariae]KAE9097428.1 hypothetical protein PF010_g15964 [Phytophthora fragariae]KAE9246005.1 hypothetical protein PF002_g6952 [Phytophthora fragariae]KAE9328962.1 hypothetical protein PR003_g15665 [Phytophthora rubi]